MFKILKHFCPKLIKLAPNPDDTLLLMSMGYIYYLILSHFCNKYPS